MGPSLDGQIGLGVEPNAEDYDCEETGDVAGEFPVLPFSGLAWRWGCSVHEVSVGLFLVARGCPSARPISVTASEAETTT